VMVVTQLRIRVRLAGRRLTKDINVRRTLLPSLTKPPNCDGRHIRLGGYMRPTT
jgi:hypothetical protein